MMELKAHLASRKVHEQILKSVPLHTYLSCATCPKLSVYIVCDGKTSECGKLELSCQKTVQSLILNSSDLNVVHEAYCYSM